MRNHRHRACRILPRREKARGPVIRGVKGICLSCHEYKRLAPDSSQNAGKCWDCSSYEVRKNSNANQA